VSADPRISQELAHFLESGLSVVLGTRNGDLEPDGAVAWAIRVHESGDRVTVFLHEWRVIEDDAAWKAIRAARREFEDAVEAVLREGCETGVFELRDTRLATLGFLGMINYSYQWFRPGGRFGARAIADQLSGTYLDGIRSTG